MGDEGAPYTVKYVDGSGEDDDEELKWIARAGKALVTYSNGCTYEGEFNSEKQKHGAGVYTWMKLDEESGEAKKVACYEGQYADGKKNGLGKMTFPNGDVYHGEWKDNKFEGEGSYTYAKTKDVYSGAWVAGVKSGNGCYEYGEDKSKLNGLWDAGAFASGEWILEGAGVFSGAFANGKPSGPGTFTFASGVQQDGEYVIPPLGEDEDPEGPRPDPVWVGNAVFSTVAA